MSLPLDIILEELETSPKSIIPILATLHNDKALLNGISKADLKHLVSRTLNLSKSNVQYNKWCGINLIKILGSNYTILANDGVNFINQLLKILETYNPSVGQKILTSTIECLNYLCDQIRGKPTLTREILTPKLPTIITLYMEHITHQPLLIIQSLNSLIRKHPTVFRPFGNKLRNRIIEFLTSGSYNSFPPSLRLLTCETLATLPLIEKNEPDTKWQTDVIDLVKELSQVLLIYGEFLNLNEDSDLMGLFQRIPQSRDKDEKLLNYSLPLLDIDINKSESIFQISDRVELLLSIMRAYLNSETQFSVRVPIGMILLISEIICSMSTKFIPFRNDIRDDKLKSLVKTTTLINQFNVLKLLSDLPSKYQGSLIPHLNNVLAFLEILIPFKNKKIDQQEILQNEGFMCKLLECSGNLLCLLSNLNEASLLIRFIDVALCLVEARNSDILGSSDGNQQKQQVNGNKKNKKRNNQAAVPLSDLLSHQHLFSESIPHTTIGAVRKFINIVITRVSLPPTQHYKVFRYLVIQANTAKSFNKDKVIPDELRELLINSVLFPGFEKISMLPIITSLLGDDQLLSVFNNPRFPPLPIYVKKYDMIIEEADMDQSEEEVDEEENISVHEEEEMGSDNKRRKISISGSSTSVGDGDLSITTQKIPDVVVEIKDQEKLFTNDKIKPELVIQFAERTDIIEPTQSEAATTSVEPIPINSLPEPISVVDTISVTENVEEKDDSDFEMPSIDLGGDSDNE